MQISLLNTMNMPFSLPIIDSDVFAEMNDTLTNTSWLISGPKVVALENEFKTTTIKSIKEANEGKTIKCVDFDDYLKKVE